MVKKNHKKDWIVIYWLHNFVPDFMSNKFESKLKLFHKA